ncbi:MAG: hypothetical protein A3I66_02215 [Burkholderiales bacterium RIFCSPLOWO2_02_FULL_57_36]|nr:MAG: hypothetical protein A3I66_02215 [Burkholderiales bacterium RIFCSPLOWO2_02_FULL_57_36]
MMNIIFDKTDKGREEIATRKHRLSLRLRRLLVVIDGKHSKLDLLKEFTQFGIHERSFTELHENGFIRNIVVLPDLSAAPAKSGRAAPDVPAGSKHTAKPALVTQSQPNRLEALHQFYTGAIKNTLGLRGYGLRLKVDRAGSLEDFAALRAQFLEAVFNVKGADVARAMRDELDRLLHAGPMHASFDSSSPHESL